MNTNTKTCSLDDCKKKRQGKGYCGMHYYRFKKYGHTNLMPKTPHGEPLECFYKALKIQTDDCIEWLYGKSRGYGNVTYKGKSTKVHRLALLLTVGPPTENKPNALHVPDICHNRACFNPRHLYWGSQKENMDDKIIDGTNKHAIGEDHGRAKLTEKQVLAIRADVRTQKVIAQEYGINKGTVGHIKNRKRWKHI